MTSRIGFVISMFGTRMCGQTLLFIVMANCAIRPSLHLELNLNLRSSCEKARDSRQTW